jgi:DNA-binding response OmpR family regulator
VEDEWLVRMEIADALSAAGWRVIESGSGEEAIALLPPESPVHLLVTDIRLGGALSGWDVAERYRLAVPTIAVIYASANPAIEERFVPGGVFMSKPSLIRELVATSERLWHQASQPE